MTYPLIVRLAKMEDAVDLLRWRNDLVTRAMSRNTSFVDWDTHSAWFSKTLGNPDRLIYIGAKCDHKVGMVRYDRLGDSNEWEIAIAIAPEFRGKGLGKAILAATMSEFLVLHPGIALLAMVKESNLASRRVVESAGFICTEAYETKMLKFIFPSDLHG